MAETWCTAEGLELTEATPSQIAEYATTRPNTPSVRSHLRSALKRWYDWRETSGPYRAVRVPREGPMVCKALEPSEARDMVKTSMGWWRAGTAVLVGCYLGLRNEEIAAMRWDGFDSAFTWYTLVGKGNRQRTLPVHPTLASELRGRENGSPYVFEGRFGGHVSHATIWNWVRAVADEAGVEGEVYPHRLRHTALATANDNTGDLRAVQAFAGHSKIETTSGYTRTTADKLRAVSQSLDYLT